MWGGFLLQFEANLQYCKGLFFRFETKSIKYENLEFLLRFDAKFIIVKLFSLDLAQIYLFTG